MNITATDALEALDREALKALGTDSVALVSIAGSLDRIALALEVIAARIESWDKLGAVEVSIRQPGNMISRTVAMPKNSKPTN